MRRYSSFDILFVNRAISLKNDYDFKIQIEIEFLGRAYDMVKKDVDWLLKRFTIILFFQTFIWLNLRLKGKGGWLIKRNVQMLHFIY